uniref:Uncharacterized protein n=1 Tax=Caenorhabditis japonica TaxID=281687 RepID=A0A8R1IZF4_CAEJA
MTRLRLSTRSTFDSRPDFDYRHARLFDFRLSFDYRHGRLSTLDSTSIIAMSIVLIIDTKYVDNRLESDKVDDNRQFSF